MSASERELPEHVADAGEWRDWPLKLDAHLKWGVRQRQIESYARSGRLKVFVCPDGSKRIEPDALRELFGEPGVFQGADRNLSAAERRQRQAEAAAPPDPFALMFGKVVGMLEATNGQLLAYLKLIPEPMKQLIEAYQHANKALSDRVAFLESQANEAAVLRSELVDNKQERDLALRRHEASERRKDETLALLKEQVPALVGQYLSGNSLSDFAKRAPKDVIQTIVDSEVLGPADAETLRRGAGIPAPAAPQPQTQTVNGVS
jgi:hypothetical protein